MGRVAQSRVVLGYGPWSRCAIVWQAGPQQRARSEVRVMALRALLNLRCIVCGLAQIRRFVMALHAGLQQRLLQQVRLLAAVHFMAFHAQSLGHGGVSDIRPEITTVTALAGIREVVSYVHLLSRVVAALAVPCKVGGVNRNVL